MSGLILRRLLQLPLIVLGVYTIAFALAWLLPGSAVVNDEGRRPPEAVLRAMEERYGLDDPARFYARYLWRASGASWVAARARGDEPRGPVFDLGPSLRYEDWTVNELLAGSLPTSLALGVTGVLFGALLGVLAGVAAAVRPGTWIEAAAHALVLLGISTPSFVIGTLLLLIFPVWLGIGRVASWSGPSDLILPAITLGLPIAASVARLVRPGLVEALRSDYARTARAKGVPEPRVVTRHALRNAILPVVSYLGPAAAFAVTGSFVVETVFNVPGVGQHFVTAVQNKDLFVILGVTLVLSITLVIFNLAVDVLYGLIDPRISSDANK